MNINYGTDCSLTYAGKNTKIMEQIFPVYVCRNKYMEDNRTRILIIETTLFYFECFDLCGNKIL